MKATLIRTGGFAGVAAKWEFDGTSHGSTPEPAGPDIKEFERLISLVRAKGALGRDYTAPSSRGPSAGKPNPAEIPADLQSYELVIDGQSVKWTEPGPTGSGGAPGIVSELASWIMENAKRGPVRPN